MKKVLFMLLLCSIVGGTLVGCEGLEPEKEEQKGENNKGNKDDDDDEEEDGTWIDCFACDDMPDGECSYCQGDGILGGSKVCNYCGGSGVCATCGGEGERYVKW